jgi:hypothetical protein
MQYYCPFARAANQDKKYFPLGTSPAKPARVDWRQDREKFENGLVKLLGCHRAASDYIQTLEAKARARQRE